MIVNIAIGLFLAFFIIAILRNNNRPQRAGVPETISIANYQFGQWMEADEGLKVAVNARWRVIVKEGSSITVVNGTDTKLIAAVNALWGPLTIDLAATPTNAKAPRWIEHDSLSRNWTELIGAGVGWLNPPLTLIDPWVRKCIGEAKCGARICLLHPVEFHTHWFWDLHCVAATYVLWPPMLANGLQAVLAVSTLGLGSSGVFGRLAWADREIWL